VLAATFLGFVALVAACDKSTAGQALPAAGASGTGETSSSAPASTSDSSTSPAQPTFTNTQLCGLLTAGEAGQLGGSATGEAGNSLADGAPQCQWSDATGLIVAFHDGTQSKDVAKRPGVTYTPTQVAGLTAMKAHDTGAFETCEFDVDISPDSVMGFSAGIHDEGKGKFEVCDLAMNLANIVIPKVKQR
jgi:hypothetical protein